MAGRRLTHHLSKKTDDKASRDIYDTLKRKGKPSTIDTRNPEIMDIVAQEFRSGNVPEFYHYSNGGWFGENFGGYMPGKLDADLEPFFEGDAVNVLSRGGFDWGYLAPLNSEYDALLEAARKKKSLAESRVREAKGGRSYGLHPFKRKRSTPFTIDKPAFAAFLAGNTDFKGGDEGGGI